MSEQSELGARPGGWNEFVEQMNDQFVEAFEANMKAQAEFVESWSEAIDSSTESDRVSEGAEGYARAYQVWMDAAETMVEQSVAATEGEDIAVEDFRDVWLNAANEAFKEIMSTTAFAAATGQTIEDALELRQAADETAAETLHSLGLATEGDIREVGERLVELERRQHGVERKLDRLLDHIEES